MQPHLGDLLPDLYAAIPFDFVIGSLHSTVDRCRIRTTGELFCRAGRTQEVYRQAFAGDCWRISESHARTLTCWGIWTMWYAYGKERDESSTPMKNYADEIDEILRSADHQNGKGIELNMAGLKYGLPFAHPHPDVLKRYRELGGEIITVGADGH